MGRGGLLPRGICGIGTKCRRPNLSGEPTQRVVVAAFALTKFGGVLLAGRACKATQAMGGACLLRAIAAVVFGGTSILGGRGSYLGTVGLCS